MSIYILKGLVYRLSHDCHLDIDRDVSTAHCRSSSGDIVDLLSRTICTTLVLSDWVSRTMVGGFRSKALTVSSEEETDPSGDRCGGDRLLCCLTVGIHASGISIPPSLLMLLGWNLAVNSLSNSTTVPGRVSVNKLNFVTEGIMHRLIGLQCVQK